MNVQKFAFTFNAKIYKQIDGVSIGSPLETLLANILKTELEKDIIQKLVDKAFIKYYIRYVDATVLLVEDEVIESLKN